MALEVTKVNMYIPQGSTYGHSFLYRKSSDELIINITGFTARLQIRERLASPSAIFEATTDDYITVTGSIGEVYLEIPAAITEAWTWRTGVYDLEIISGTGAVTRIARGNVKVYPEVTR